MEQIFLVFWVSVFIILIIKKQVKALPGFCVVLITAVLMCFNTYNPDYKVFEEFYYSIHDLADWDHGVDYLYILVNKVASFLGLDFFEFRCVYISACLLSLYMFSIKHTTHIGLCMLMYFFTSGVFDYIQLRQFGALAISIWMIDFLMKKNEKKNIFKFICLILCASGFHKSALLYLVFVPYFFVDPKKQKKIYGLCAVLMVAIIYIALETPVIYSLMRQFAGEGTASYYLVSNHYTDNIYKIVVDIIIQQIILILIIYLKNKWNRTTEVDSRSCMVVLAIDWLITALMPLNILTIQFKRVSRITLIPSFAVALNTNKKSERWVIRKKDVIITSLLIVYVILYCRITLHANPSIMSDLFTYFNR